MKKISYEPLKRRLQRYVNIYHLFRAVIAYEYYRNPSARLKVIGVTGTDGKTTTTHLIYHVLTHAKKRASMMSTVYAKIGDQTYDTGLHMTTPDSILVERLLKKAVEHGDEYFVFETTSHAFDQNRNWGVRYAVGVITNVTHEHLDYHKTYERYLMTKALIIRRSQVTIINHDDASYSPLMIYARQRGLKLPKTYGLVKKSDYHKNIAHETGLNLTSYNNYNYLAAYSVCRELGVDERDIYAAFKSFKLPKGRLDTVYDQKFRVVIDFAHTPNSFQQLLPELKKMTKGRLIHVFGSAGLRDNTKRATMGEVSSRYSDVVIVTEEDYRTEDPQSIAEEVIRGIKEHDFMPLSPKELDTTSMKRYAYIQNRQDAITRALAIAAAGDLVVITGKSHEMSLCRGTIEYPWDEYDAVIKALAARDLKADI